MYSEHSQVDYQIIGNIAKSTMKENIQSFNIPLVPGVGSKGQIVSFLKVFMLYLKLKCKKCRPTIFNFTHTHITDLWILVDRSATKIVQVNILFIKLSTKTHLTDFCYDLKDVQIELRV